MVEKQSMWPSQELSMEHLSTTKNTMSLQNETPSPMGLVGLHMWDQLSVFHLAECPLGGPA